MPFMDKRKKTGIIFIIVGICFPLLALPFVSGYSRDRSFWANLYKIGIPIREDAHSMAGNEPPARVDSSKDNGSRYSILIPKRIPFRFFLVITVLCLYVGIAKLAPPRREEDGH